MRRLVLLPLVLILAAMALAPQAKAQSNFLIPVTSSSGAAIAGATVTLTCLTNGCGVSTYTGTSDATGNVQFTSVVAGRYTVTTSGPRIVTYSYTLDVSVNEKPQISDAIQYVSSNGSDSNDGLSMGTAKATPQGALNALPGGKGTVYVSNGTYLLTNTTNEQIKITNSVNFMCQSWNTILQVGSSVGAIPVIHVVPSGVVRGVRIQDCHIQPQSGTPGSYGIQVDTSPNNNMNLFIVEHVWVEQLGTGSIWMNNTGAEANGGLFDGQIEHSYLNGGILGTLIGDSLSISKNLIQGTGTSIDVSFTLGSSTLRVEDNTMNPTTNAAIHIGSGANFTQIQGNEFETPNSTGTGSNGAYVDIDGTMANPAFQVDLNHNSFQMVNGSTLTALRLNWSHNANVRENSFSARGAAAFAIAITANATGTRLRPNSFGGDTIAHAISDSSTLGQTQYEFGGQASTYIGIAYANSDGSTFISGQTTTAQQFGGGVNGANYIYDGQTNTIVSAFAPLGGGVPSVAVSGFVKSQTPLVAEVNLTAQNNNIGTTTLYAVPAAGAGHYRASCYLVETTNAGTSSTLPQCNIIYTDADSSVVITNQATGTNANNTVGSIGNTSGITGLVILEAKASTNIQYQTTGYASNAANAMQYSLHLRLEFLGP